MKYLFIIIAMMLIACDEDSPNVTNSVKGEEAIHEIQFITGSYESVREFDTITINKNIYIFKQGRGIENNGNDNFEKNIDSIEFAKISECINIDEFFELDSIILSHKGEYPGSRDDGVIELEILLKNNSHKVICSIDSLPIIINCVNNEIRELHEKLIKE